MDNKKYLMFLNIEFQKQDYNLNEIASFILVRK